MQLIKKVDLAQGETLCEIPLEWRNNSAYKGSMILTCSAIQLQSNEPPPAFEYNVVFHRVNQVVPIFAPNGSGSIHCHDEQLSSIYLWLFSCLNS
jgi:hypothetical protein